MACTEADYEYLRSVVFEYSSNAFDKSRNQLFDSRLAPLLKSTGHRSLAELVSFLRRESSLALKRSIAEAMTVNETSFFRDYAPFALMQLQLVPDLIKRRASSRRLRFWSAACSTGQEAYSLAMMLCEHFPQLRDWDIEISGTDISPEVVARAQSGRYGRLEVNRGLPARFLLKYTGQVGDEWEIVSDLKAMCRFQQRNLCRFPLLVEKYDGILLRNVMLYFSEQTRRQLLLNLHRVLAPDGFLILGASEQASVRDRFHAVQAHSTFYYRPIHPHPRSR